MPILLRPGRLVASGRKKRRWTRRSRSRPRSRPKRLTDPIREINTNRPAGKSKSAQSGDGAGDGNASRSIVCVLRVRCVDHVRGSKWSASPMNRRQLLTYGAFGLGGAAFAPGLAWNRPLAARGQGDRSQIEQIVIHPAIGVARVGNSPHEWFLGPETPGPHPVPSGGFKDAAGRLKRQAARFRLYGLNGEGQVVSEGTATDAEIRWSVHLANSKAAWYNFDLALDIPQARGLPAAPLQAAPDPTRSLRRNAAITDRASLQIDPGPRSVAGANASVDGDD